MNRRVKQLAGLFIRKNGPSWQRLARNWRRAGDYCRATYRGIAKDSVFWREEEMGMCSLYAPKLIAKTVELFAPKTVLDIGCGTGRSLECFLAHGVDATGVEGSALAVSKSRHPDRIRVLNLNYEVNLAKKFDLVWSFEVVEHIHPRYVHNLMRTLVNHGNRVVLSAAKPGQGGEGHFNEQPASYWIDLFQQYGLACDKHATAQLQGIDEQFSENMLSFVRTE